MEKKCSSSVSELQTLLKKLWVRKLFKRFLLNLMDPFVGNILYLSTLILTVCELQTLLKMRLKELLMSLLSLFLILLQTILVKIFLSVALFFQWLFLSLVICSLFCLVKLYEELLVEGHGGYAYLNDLNVNFQGKKTWGFQVLNNAFHRNLLETCICKHWLVWLRIYYLASPWRKLNWR